MSRRDISELSLGHNANMLTVGVPFCRFAIQPKSESESVRDEFVSLAYPDIHPPGLPSINSLHKWPVLDLILCSQLHPQDMLQSSLKRLFSTLYIQLLKAEFKMAFTAIWQM